MPNKWGFAPGDRVKNPVGGTGLMAALALLVTALAEVLDIDGVDTATVGVVMAALLGLFAEKVRRQPSAPDDD